jgi:CRP-like cAMP-binding protein
VYLKKGQVLFSSGQTDNVLYFILFGKLRLFTRPERLEQSYLQSSQEFHNQQRDLAPFGDEMNIGWTVGEEILFEGSKAPQTAQNVRRMQLAMQGSKEPRTNSCKSVVDSCVLGLFVSNLLALKNQLEEIGRLDDFNQIDLVLRGNYLVKQKWREQLHEPSYLTNRSSQAFD